MEVRRLAEAAATWQRQIPSLSVAGTQHGYISQEEEKLRQTHATQPQVIFVGLECHAKNCDCSNRFLCPQATWICRR